MQKISLRNQSVLERFIVECIGNQNDLVADETLAEDVEVVSGVLPYGAIRCRKMFKTAIGSLAGAFSPIAPVQIIDQFAVPDSERVMVPFQSSARHTSRFFGIEATQRENMFDETYVARVRDGRTVKIVSFQTKVSFALLIAPVLGPMIWK